MPKRNPYFAKTGLQSDNVRAVCAAASLRVYDPCFDDHWSFKPNHRPRKHVERKVDFARLVAHLLK
jgi:hypothetical protein